MVVAGCGWKWLGLWRQQPTSVSGRTERGRLWIGGGRYAGEASGNGLGEENQGLSCGWLENNQGQGALFGFGREEERLRGRMMVNGGFEPLNFFG